MIASSPWNHYEEAKADFQLVIDQTHWQKIDALKTQTDRARQTAISSGADRLPRFAKADLKWRIAMEAWESRDLVASEQTFAATGVLFASLVDESRANHARDEARRERDQILHLDEDISADELSAGDDPFSSATDQLEAGKFAAATNSFAAALGGYRKILIQTRRNQIELTHTHTIQAKERAKSQNAESSRHYEQAERGLSEAEQLLDAGKPADARPLLENATREFALAGLATRARTAEETMTRSRESAFSLGLSAESPGVEAAESMASDARLAYASQSYHQAIERFTTATALLDEVIENTLRSRATQARKDVTETLAKIGPEADRSAPVLQAARQHIRSAESALSDADFLRAFDLFDAARRLLEELQLELVTDTAEHDMHEALSRALSVGVSGELGELAVGLSHRRMGESLRAENNLDAARVAFESATKAFEQAVLVEREMRALRARDAAAAVRGSAARNGADTLEHFAWSNARFDEGVASLTRGEYETAYVRFREAQNGFDQAAVEWAATQAQKATISALDETRIAGVPEDDIAVVTALAAMERATELRFNPSFR